MLQKLLYRIHIPLLILRNVVTAYGMVFWTDLGAYTHGGKSQNRKSLRNFSFTGADLTRIFCNIDFLK